MNIALLTSSCRGGGAQRVQLTLAQEFGRLGHAVHFVSCEDDGQLRNQIPRQVQTTCFGVSRVAQAVLPLARFLRLQKPDAMIAAMTHVGTIAFIAQHITNWRGKLIIRIDSSHRNYQQQTPIHKRWVLDALQRIVFPRVYAMVAVSNAVAEEYRANFHLQNCRMVHNPVATRLEQPNQADTPMHPFFTEGKPIVMAIGRLREQKGFSFLLEAFAELRKTHRAKLLILGEGDERSSLEEKIEEMDLGEHVCLPGFVNNPLAYLKHATVFALSSITESFGLALVEALSAGIPAICTRTEGPKDIINHPDLGELVRYGDVDGFADALRRAVDQSQRNRDRRIARAMDFAPERIAARYLQLIENGS